MSNMRPLKFRVWHKNQGKWLDYEDFYLDSLGRVFTTKYSEIGEPHTDITDDVKLTQYTGLKDKNGKEIYEWDIVEIKSELNGRKTIDTIVYERDGFKTKNGGQIPRETRLEVIGNAYENPELLK